MKGHVYILTNEHMPGLIKVGMTTGDPEVRASQLFQTGVPGPFMVAHSVFSPDCAALERCMHENMTAHRVCENREFFRATISEAIALLDDTLMEQVKFWLEEFLPDKIIVDPDLSCDAGDICYLADQLNEPPPIVASAFSEITSEEIRPAVLRVYDRIARHKEKAAQR